MKLITQILILISLNSFSQDSVKLKITRVRTHQEKTWYVLKDENGNRYITECGCKRKKGEWVLVAKKDLKIIKETFTKQDL